MHTGQECCAHIVLFIVSRRQTCLGPEANRRTPCRLFLGLTRTGNEPRDLSGGLRGLQTASENIRRVFVWSSAKNHTKKPCMWLPGTAPKKRSLGITLGEDRTETCLMLSLPAFKLRKGLRGMRGWSERMSEFGSQEVVG